MSPTYLKHSKTIICINNYLFKQNLTKPSLVIIHLPRQAIFSFGIVLALFVGSGLASADGAIDLIQSAIPLIIIMALLSQDNKKENHALISTQRKIVPLSLIHI